MNTPKPDKDSKSSLPDEVALGRSSTALEPEWPKHTTRRLIPSPFFGEPGPLVKIYYLDK